MHRELTVIVDSREKKPLLFPATLAIHDANRPLSRTAIRNVSVRVQVERMEWADYCLADDRTGVVIERKGSAREIAGNLYSPRRRSRILAEIDAMATLFRHPVWLLYGTPSTLLAEPEYVPALDFLLGALLKARMGIIFIPPPRDPPSRRRAGELALRTMIRGLPDA